MSAAEVVTLVVVAGGELGDRIARLAADRATFDPLCRRVTRRRDSHNETALIVEIDGEPRAVLNASRATNAAWIEDAFVRYSVPRTARSFSAKREAS